MSPPSAATGPSAIVSRTSWFAPLLLVSAAAAYSPALRGAFIWNDGDYVTAPALRSWHGLARIWTEPGATQQYYPLLHSLFWFEHRTLGDAPFGYHLVSLLLHVLAAWLFAAVLRRLAVPGAAPAALLFALHPVQAESVAWISEQKNTFSAVFFFAAAFVYLGYDQRRNGRAYMAATGLFVCALTSKTVTATLPGVILVALWWRRGYLEWKRDVLPLLPWIGAGAAIGLYSGWVERHFIGAEGDAFTLTLAQRTLVAGRALWFYLAKLLWPFHLAFVYPRWHPDPLAAWQWLFPLAAAGAAATAWRWRSTDRAPLALLLIFAGTLFPVLGFLNVYAFLFSFVADHFQYLACAAVFVAIGAGWDRWRRTSTVPAFAAAAITLALLATLTARQARGFRDLPSFYRSILAANPGAWMAENNLGVMALERGDREEALRRLRAAIALRPDYPEARNNLGNVLTALGRSEAALAEYRTSAELAPRYVDGQNSLGNALAAAGRLAEAHAHLALAVELAPNSPFSHYNLANVLASEGHTSDAILHYRKAIALQPDYPEAENNLAATLAATGDLAGAVAHYDRALALRPDYPEAENNLGVALARTGKLADAIGHFQNAVRLRPGYREAAANLESVRTLISAPAPAKAP